MLALRLNCQLDLPSRTPAVVLTTGWLYLLLLHAQVEVSPLGPHGLHR